MKYLKRGICYLKAVRDFLKHGVWVPHVFGYTCEKTIIIATEHSFRVARSFEHTSEETVYKDAYLIRNRCIHCGKEELSWARDGRFLDL